VRRRLFVEPNDVEAKEMLEFRLKWSPSCKVFLTPALLFGGNILLRTYPGTHQVGR